MYTEHTLRLTLCLMIIMGGVVGCMSLESEPDPLPEEAFEYERQLSMMTLSAGEALQTDQVYLEELQERTDTYLDVQFVPPMGFHEIFMVSFAARDLPEIMFMEDIFGGFGINAARQGAFHSLDEYLDDFSDYPHLGEIPDQIWDNIKIDGHIYNIPRPTGLVEQAIHIRKDWLDELHLEVPQTVDEYLQVIQAFREEAPNQSGQGDTVGLAISRAVLNDQGSLLEPAFGVNEPALEDEMMLFPWMTDQFRDYLQFKMELLSVNGLGNDFLTMSAGQEKDMFMNGQAGSVYGPINEAWQYQERLQESDPNAEVLTLPPLEGPDGMASQLNDGYQGSFAIPFTVSEDKIEQALQFLDLSASEEITRLTRYGIEGVHYEIEDGEMVRDMDAFRRDIGYHYITVNQYEPYRLATNENAPSAFTDRQQEVYDQYLEVAAPHPHLGLYSEEHGMHGSVLTDLETNKMRVILQDMSIQEWDQFVQDMRQIPEVQEMMQEYYEEYQIKYGD